MAEEYDVEAEIRVDDSTARGATARLSIELQELIRLSLNLGSVLTAVFKGIKPEMAGFVSAVHGASANMKMLDTNTAHLVSTIKPLGSALANTAKTAQNFERTAARGGSLMTSAFQRAGRASGGLSSMLRSTLALAGAYVGFRAFSGIFSSLVRDSFTYTASMDKYRVSLAAILSATQPALLAMTDPLARMAAAGKIGGQIFSQLQADALASVATSAEMFQIYSAIAGPLAGAGANLSEIRKITNDTVASATVLNVDLAQAARDINLMATGAAGTDTLLFRMLQSTKQITENTQQWNKMLPAKRLQRIKEALSGFAPAASAFEKTLPGITSSFVDYMQRFRGILMAGPLEGVRQTLVKIVDVFRKNESRIAALLQVMGNAFARFLDPALNAFARATDWFLNNWERIAHRIERSYQNLRNVGAVAQHYAPALKTGATVAGGSMLVGRLAPGAISAIGAGVSMGLAGGAGATATGAAGAVAGGAAATGGIAGAISEIVLTTSVIAAMGGTFTILLPIFTVLVGLVGLLADTWSHIVPILAIFATYFQDVGSVVWGLASAIWGAFMPLAKIVGVAVGSLLLLGATISFLFVNTLWTYMFKPIVKVITLLFTYLGDAFTWIYNHVVGIFTGLADFFGWVFRDLLPKGAKGGGGIVDSVSSGMAGVIAGYEALSIADDGMGLAVETGAPGARKTTVNDFRGSKIEVKQDFRQADPDNIWLQFVEGINDAAEQRLASALVPDFTR